MALGLKRTFRMFWSKLYSNFYWYKYIFRGFKIFLFIKKHVKSQYVLIVAPGIQKALHLYRKILENCIFFFIKISFWLEYKNCLITLILYSGCHYFLFVLSHSWSFKVFVVILVDVKMSIICYLYPAYSILCVGDLYCRLWVNPLTDSRLILIAIISACSQS